MTCNFPEIRFVANLWTLTGHPSERAEWTLEEKVAAIKDAGFDGVNDRASEDLRGLLRSYELGFSGLFDANDPAEYGDLIEAQLACGSSTINVQLCDRV